MDKFNSNDQTTILRFFDKHKWRIILPVLFSFLYFGVPNYLGPQIVCTQSIFIKSASLSREQLNEEVKNTSDQILTDKFLRGLIVKYDLFSNDQEKGIAENLLIKKVRKSIVLRANTDNLFDSVYISIWVNLRAQNPQTLMDITNSISAQFEENQNFQVMKYITLPYDANPYRDRVLVGTLFQGLVLFSIPLILIWEIPSLFYSKKTKEMVFDQIKADWQSEVYDAKLRNQTWQIIKINFYYSLVFINALWQKSPIGDLVEYVKKRAI